MMGTSCLRTVAAACMVVGPTGAVTTDEGADPLFPGSAIPIGFYLSHATVADLDVDGRPDIVALDWPANVRVLLGKGNGSFEPAGEHALAGLPFRAVAADLDGDGWPDLCVAHDEGLAVLLGAGGGDFEPAIATATGSALARVAAGDLDGDGWIDVVATEFGSRASARILLGHGDGMFTQLASVPLPLAASDVLLPDLDADGELDLVVTCGSPVKGIGIALGLGGGLFGPVSVTQFGVQPYDAEPGDFDPDGILDLAAGDLSAYALYGQLGLFVLQGAGDGTIAEVHGYEAGNQPWTIATGDIQGDGLPDIAAGTFLSSWVSVRPGAGASELGDLVTLPMTFWPIVVSLADFTGDGLADVLAVDDHLGVVRPGNGDGSFVAPTGLAPPPGAGGKRVSVWDMDGDGHLDAVLNGTLDLAWIAYGNGDGALTAGPPYATGPEPLGLAVADVDGDGHAEIATCSKDMNQVWVLPGLPGGALGAAVPYLTAGGPFDAEFAELTGDSQLDLVVANHYSNNLTLLRKTPSGFLPLAPLPAGDNPVDVEFGDFNNDGRLDLATLNLNSDNVSILLAQVGGPFLSAGEVDALNAPDDLWVADLDDDGVQDLAVAAKSAVAVMPGNGDGTFREPSVVSSAGYPEGVCAVEAGDVDADGYVDLVSLNGDGTCSLMRGKPSSGFGPVFGPQQDFVIQAGCYDLALGDMDENGTLDILVPSGLLYILQAQSPPVWLDKGSGLGGPQGVPVLECKGSLEPLLPVHLGLSQAAPSAAAVLVVGTTMLGAPFKGGTLVPQPESLVWVGTDAAGGISASMIWPAGVPPATSFLVQAWIADTGGPQGYSASNALQGVTP